MLTFVGRRRPSRQCAPRPWPQAHSIAGSDRSKAVCWTLLCTLLADIIEVMTERPPGAIKAMRHFAALWNPLNNFQTLITKRDRPSPPRCLVPCQSKLSSEGRQAKDAF